VTSPSAAVGPPAASQPAPRTAAPAPPAASQPAPRTAAPETAAAVPPSVPEKDGPVVSAEIGRIIEISLPGLGWIFLGEEDDTGAVKYQGKKTTEDGTVFSFLAFRPGDYRLRFQQQSLPSNRINHQDVRVAVARDRPAPDEGAGPTAAQSPRDPGEGPSGAAGTVTPGPAVETEEGKLERLLQEGRIREAVAGIEEYLRRETGSDGNADSWHFRLAELYERNTEVKNMKKALYFYERLQDLYPMSPRFEDAARRARYIRVNFIQIR